MTCNDRQFTQLTSHLTQHSATVTQTAINDLNFGSSIYLHTYLYDNFISRTN